MRTDDGAEWETDWGTLLTVPVEGYLEVSEGPFPLRCVEWVQLVGVTLHQRRGGGRVTATDTSETLIATLQQLGVTFEFRNIVWTPHAELRDRPVTAVHVDNRIR